MAQAKKVTPQKSQHLSTTLRQQRVKPSKLDTAIAVYQMELGYDR
jgi:hypothetical protein